MLVQDFDIEADAFLGGKGVHVATNGVHLTRNLLSRAMLRALKYHVLDKMRDTIPLRIFIPRSGLDPYPDRSRANVLQLLGDARQPIGQDLTMYVAYFLNHGFSAGSVSQSLGRTPSVLLHTLTNCG